jgi:hypothetical protein
MTFKPHSKPFSALTTRNPSRHLISRESDLEFCLDPVRPNHIRKKSDQSIEEALLERSAMLQAKLARKRLVAQAQMLQELRQAPSVHSNSLKAFKPTSQSKIKEIIDKLPKKAKKIREKKQEKVITVRPQDVIEMPDAEYLKELLNRIVPKHTTEKIEWKSMNIHEKTKYFTTKKTEKLEEAKKKREKEIAEVCTFKPNTQKPEIKLSKHRKSVESLPNADIQEEVNEIKLRPPPPNKMLRTSSQDFNGDNDTQVIISASYSQLSPAKRVYGYKDGLDLKSLKKRSRNMLRYNTYSSRK